MGGRTLDRPSSDEANLFEGGLASGSASQLTRAAVHLSPVLHLSGDEPPPENPPSGRGGRKLRTQGFDKARTFAPEPPLLFALRDVRSLGGSLMPCYWPKAKNAGGVGAEPLFSASFVSFGNRLFLPGFSFRPEPIMDVMTSPWSLGPPEGGTPNGVSGAQVDTSTRVGA
jgi:hypothetical protein